MQYGLAGTNEFAASMAFSLAALSTFSLPSAVAIDCVFVSTLAKIHIRSISSTTLQI